MEFRRTPKELSAPVRGTVGLGRAEGREGAGSAAAAAALVVVEGGS